MARTNNDPRSRSPLSAIGLVLLPVGIVGAIVGLVMIAQPVLFGFSPPTGVLPGAVVLAVAVLGFLVGGLAYQSIRVGS